MLRHGARGATIVESVTVLAIVGVLASMAYPSVAQHWRTTRRMDAYAAVARVQQAEERFRGERSSYADGFITHNGRPDGALLRMAEVDDGARLGELRSADGHYLLRVSAADARGFTVVATALGAQAHDRRCSTLSLTLDGDVSIYASRVAGSDVDSELANRCWRR